MEFSLHEVTLEDGPQGVDHSALGGVFEQSHGATLHVVVYRKESILVLGLG